MPLSRPWLRLALLLLGLAAPLHAQERPKPVKRTVAGVVVDSATGRPLVAAHVLLAKREVFTDSAGRFTITRIPDGLATVEAEQLGYAPGMVGITVADGMAPLRIALVPNPVLLQAITVMADRFRNRRNFSPYSVQTFDHTALMAHGWGSLRDFLLYRAGMTAGACPGDEGASGIGGTGFPSLSSPAPGEGLCARVRGQWLRPTVFIDDRRAFADELSTYTNDELFLVEVYGRGRMIRAYTTWWVAAMAKRPLPPIYY